MRRWCRSDKGLRLRLRLSFGNWRSLEEVFSQGGFKIGYKLAHLLRLRHPEASGRGVPDRLKFLLNTLRFATILSCRCLRGSVFDNRLGLMRDRPRKKTLSQRRFKIGNELLKNPRRWSWRWRWRDFLHCRRFNDGMLIV